MQDWNKERKGLGAVKIARFSCLQLGEGLVRSHEKKSTEQLRGVRRVYREKK